jgi:hypothetical protein
MPLMLYEYGMHRRGDDLRWALRWPWPARAALYAYLVLMLLLFQPETASEFIYFQF